MWCTSLDQQPLFNNNIFMSLYFVVFVIICVFFILNMVIVVAINQFNCFKRETGKSALMTESQQEWITVQRIMATTQPKKKYIRPALRIKRWAFDIVMTDAFDTFMILTIITNVLVMCLTHYGQGPSWERALSAANVAFTGVYVSEMTLKLLAIGFREYFRVSLLALCMFSLTYLHGSSWSL
jgi:hypothetical protein